MEKNSQDSQDSTKTYLIKRAVNSLSDRVPHTSAGAEQLCTGCSVGHLDFKTIWKKRSETEFIVLF